MSNIAFETTACPVGGLLSELENASLDSPDSRCRRDRHVILKQRALRDFHGEEIRAQLYVLPYRPKTGSQRKVVGLLTNVAEGRDQSFVGIV